MGASLEVYVPLREHRLDSQYGTYLSREQVEKEAPTILPIWDAWLTAQSDPGNYEAYKVIRNGTVEWVCDTFMPPAICVQLKEILKDAPSV